MTGCKLFGLVDTGFTRFGLLHYFVGNFLEKRHACVIVALIQPSIEIDEDVVFSTIKTFERLADHLNKRGLADAPAS